MDALALGSTPIPGENASGFDAKYEEEYTLVSTEIGKLGSATQGGAVSWKTVATQGQAILEQKSKDIQIAAYVGIAWQELSGFDGLRDAVTLFLALLDTFWETAFPPVAKLRRRTNAFDWWHERALAGIENSKDTPVLPAETVTNVLDAIRKLDELIQTRMPDASPLRDLLDAVRRLPTEEPSPPQTERDKEAESEDTSSKRQEEKEVLPPQNPAVSHNPSQPMSQSNMTVSGSDDDITAASKDFSAAGVRYALLAHRAKPEDPVPWQVLRLALWGKVAALPPQADGQTHIPPPDADHLAGLRRMVETGKFQEAALSGEDLFSTSIFCFDVQYIINAALEGLGDAYAEAGQRVREETARFIRRLKGVEKLAFDGGMPFADQTTQDWLLSLNETAFAATTTQSAQTRMQQQAGLCNSSNDILAKAQELAASNQLPAALNLLEETKSDSPASTMQIRVHELNLLCAAKEGKTAEALAHGLLTELETRHVADWDTELTLRVLLAARDAFSLAKDKDNAFLCQCKIARLRPSAALGWKNGL